MAGRALVDLVAPPRCAVCRRRMPDRADGAWCRACGQDMRPLQAGCPRCAAPGGDQVTGCPMVGTAVAATVAAHPWTGTVAATVRAGKLDGCHAVFPVLGVVVAQAIRDRAGSWPALDLVCPVPGDRGRRRRRGFDHAAMMARATAGVLGLDWAPVLRVAGRARDRGAGDGRAPSGVDTTWARAAAIRARRPVTGHVVLVDDVVTTGTTVVAAATALRAAGATRVSVAAVARAGRH